MNAVEIRAWNAAQDRAKDAYYGSEVDPRIQLAKATRKAAAQQRYRDRKKAQR